MTKYGLPILLAGGGLYLFSKYSHVDYDDKGRPVLIPREKFKGTISFNEALVDDNGNPIIDPDTGKVVYATPEEEEEQGIVPTVVARNIEDIFNYDSSSQELFQNSIVNNMTITADTPEWEREYILAHLELSSEMTDRIEARVSNTIDGQTIRADGEREHWFTAGSSIYQAFNDLFEAEYANSYGGNRTKELAYNHQAIDLTNEEFGYYSNNAAGIQSRIDKIAGIIGTDWDDWAPFNGNRSNYRSNGTLFEQHRGYLEDGTARFGSVRADRHLASGFTNLYVSQHYNTLDGVKIESSDYTTIYGYGDVKTSNLATVLAGLG